MSTSNVLNKCLDINVCHDKFKTRFKRSSQIFLAYGDGQNKIMLTTFFMK